MADASRADRYFQTRDVVNTLEKKLNILIAEDNVSNQDLMRVYCDKLKQNFTYTKERYQEILNKRFTVNLDINRLGLFSKFIYNKLAQVASWLMKLHDGKLIFGHL